MVIVSAFVALMAMVNVFVSLAPLEFNAVMVTGNVSVVVGVPEITPVVEFKLKPPGRAPPTILQVIGVLPPAASVWL